MVNSIENIKDLDFSNDKQVMQFIQETSSDIIAATNVDGEDLVIGIDTGTAMRVSTYQKNGWTRIMDYEIVEDDEGNPYIERTESYEK